jgi:hypothetical protein
MDVPPWVGTCKKFQEGRLLMQRYQFLATYFEGHATYFYHADTGKRKAKILAKRMVEHAKTCAICIAEDRLLEEDFYGVYK